MSKKVVLTIAPATLSGRSAPDNANDPWRNAAISVNVVWRSRQSRKFAGRRGRTTSTRRRRISSTGVSASDSFTGMAAFRQATFALSDADRPESVAGAIVNANFFDVLEVKPVLGAASPRPRRARAPRVAVVSDGLWRQRFGGRADADRPARPPQRRAARHHRRDAGRHRLPGQVPRVGAAALACAGRSAGARVDPSAQRNHGYFSVLARLSRADDRERAAGMDAVASSLERDYPTTT